MEIQNEIIIGEIIQRKNLSYNQSILITRKTNIATKNSISDFEERTISFIKDKILIILGYRDELSKYRICNYNNNCLKVKNGKENV